MRRKSLVSAVVLAASGLFAAAAQAVPTESFLLDVSNGTYMSSGSAGTVTLSEISGTEVDVSVVLNPNFYFMSGPTGTQHDSFAFNINLSTPPVVVDTVAFSPVFTFSTTTGRTEAGFGLMSNEVDCTTGTGGCATGGKTTNPTSLSFHVTNAGGISFANFVGNSGGFFFTADIFNNSTSCTTPGACTGLVGANEALPPTAIPEPETYGMLLAGLGLMGFVARRRKQHGAA